MRPPHHEDDRGDDRIDTVWEPCGTCWGQRVVHVPSHGGFERRPCPTCLGVGERVVVVPRAA